MPFPTTSSGDSSVVYDKNGGLYWSNSNATTGGISIVTLNPSTGAVTAGPFTVDAPASGSTDVQQDLAADDPRQPPQQQPLLVWTRLGPSGSSEILLSLSTNQGKTWLAPVTVAASSETHATYYYGATVTAGPDGTIDVAYHVQPGYSTLSDGGILPDGTSGETLVAIYNYNSSDANPQPAGEHHHRVRRRPERHHLQRPVGESHDPRDHVPDARVGDPPGAGEPDPAGRHVRRDG